jgi:GNAT superfamily N-acetyltransferase
MIDVVPRSADSVEIAELAAAFNAAFEGYLVPMSHTAATLGAMIATNDVRLKHSFLLGAPDGRWAGVALLGVRGASGWVAGMAVAPPWRHRGVGARLMRLLLAEAWSVGVRRMQLEALDENTAAIDLYTRLGFRTARPLAVYMGTPQWCARLDDTHPCAGCEIAPVPVEAALTYFAAFHQVQPSWQRDLPSLRQSANRLLGMGLFDREGLRAYALYASSTQGPAVLDFGSRAASPAERSRDAQRLLAAITKESPGSTLRVINVPPGDALGDALEALRCPAVNHQREMVLSLVSPRAE